MTGVCYLLEAAGRKILIDCGLFQGERELEKKNSERFIFDPRQIDCVVISHSHLDHIGRLPQLVDGHFNGRIYATPPTIEFSRLILEDSFRVLEDKARKAGVIPIFTSEAVDHVMRHFSELDYYKKTEIAPGIFLTFHNSGHILGSAISEIEAEGKKIIFSGDLGNPPAPLVKSPDFLKEADFVVVESTYGDRNHESPSECENLIENVVEETIARKGVLLIPSFAMERAQQLLYQFNNLVENHRIPRVPIFMDSPLALRITEVYKKFPQYYNSETNFKINNGDDVFNFPGLRLTHTSKESKDINREPPPKIIIAGSGMSQGGRIMHHEIQYLPDPKNTILIVSYQAIGTLGRKIAEGVKRVEILDQEIEIKARVEKISGYSSHADQKFLMNWLGSFQKPCYGDVGICEGCVKKVFVSQGEEKSAAVLASLVRDELGIEAIVPKLGDVEELK